MKTGRFEDGFVKPAFKSVYLQAILIWFLDGCSTGTVCTTETVVTPETHVTAETAERCYPEIAYQHLCAGESVLNHLFEKGCGEAKFFQQKRIISVLEK